MKKHLQLIFFLKIIVKDANKLLITWNAFVEEYAIQNNHYFLVLEDFAINAKSMFKWFLVLNANN